MCSKRRASIRYSLRGRFEMILPIILTAVVFLCSYFYFKYKETKSYWEKRGIVWVNLFFSFECVYNIWTGKKNFFYILRDICYKYPKEPVIGFCGLSKTALIVQDVDYLERIMVTDASHFMNRPFEINEEKNPFDAQLFFLPGSYRWKTIRQKVTPLFTTGKLRSMFPSFEICGESFCKSLESESLTGINLLKIFRRLVTDIQGSAIFGIEAKVLENPDSKFGRMSKKVTETGLRQLFYGLMVSNWPKLTKWLGLTVNDPDAVTYFVNVLTDAFEQRAKEVGFRNDFIQLVMELKKKGYIEVQQWDSKDDYLKAGSEDSDSSKSAVLTDGVLMTQAYSFLTAGNNGLIVSSTNAAYALAKYPEVQEKARNEVQRLVEKHSGLSFDAIKEMDYLENVIKESMRMYPPVLQTFRECSEDYTFPNGFTVLKGESITIPILVAHHNPNFFPEPESFRPERFEGQGKVRGFMPFGDGPRICLAMRYSYILIKYCMATLLLKFRLKLRNPVPIEPIEIKGNGFFYPKEDYRFDLEKLE